MDGNAGIRGKRKSGDWEGLKECVPLAGFAGKSLRSKCAPPLGGAV